MILKRWLVGDPLKTAQAAHERLSKTLALAIFSSNAISSVAYATEEILLVLILAGTAAVSWSIPISLAILLLTLILTISYRQIIYEYPEGGGAYIVARTNLGELPALIAAGALMIDYILTVAVSVAAGIAALTSAIPDLFPHREALGLTAIIFIIVMNLRGVRESGKFFAIPTYFAIGALGLMVAIVGILIYLWFRFEWQFALGAMIANVHDIVLTIGFMSVTQVDFDLTSIAALLTILGYSLNDTVVIYDRIREMLRRYKKMPMPQLLNESINSTLSRSIITHVTVTLALLALLLFGGHAIHSFTATMMFGVVLVGTYTSIFIASPILIYLGVGTGRDAAITDQ